MGLSSSQARLLSLTSRQHDIEYKAQKLEAQKLQMANESTKVYSDYEDALNSTKIQYKTVGSDGTANYIDAKYSELFDQGYILTSSQGKVYVNSSIKQKFDTYPTDAYKFALDCTGTSLGLNGSAISSLSAPVDTYYSVEGNRNDGSAYYINESLIIQNHLSTDSTLASLYSKCNSYSSGVWDSMSQDSKNQEIANRSAFRDYFYEKYGSELVQYWQQFQTGSATKAQVQGVTYNTDTNIQSQLNYYIELHHKITDAGGCTDTYPNTANGLSNLLNSGAVLSQFDKSNSKFSDTNVATNTSFQQVSDETNLKKAEAKYESDMAKIDAKDKKYDTDIASLDTERTAIKTEIDTLKTVAKDNVDRTFKLFS